jgi:hypothetical protein
MAPYRIEAATHVLCSDGRIGVATATKESSGIAGHGNLALN